MSTVRRFLDSQLRSWRLGATLLSAFGILALFTDGAGLYSVLAFDVAQRRYELGVRSARGAPATQLIFSVVAGALRVCVAGIVSGIVAGALLSRLAGALLFQVQPVEPTVHVGVFATLLAVASCAAVLPAWQALRTDPRSALSLD